jgi:uncharacterized membrane protein YjfL (UPF0719 family)
MLATVAQNLGLVFVLIAILFLGKMLLDLLVHVLHKRNADHVLSEDDNPAFGVSFFGFLTGLAIATLAGITPGEVAYSADIALMVVHGAFTIAALLITWVVYDKFILYRMRNADAIFNNRNISVGIVEAACFIAASLVLAGAWSSGGWGIVILWFFVGQLMFVFVTLLYHWIIPYDLHAEIEGNNMACAIGFSGFLIAIGILVGKAIAGPSNQIGSDLRDACLYLVVGMAALVLIRLLIGRVFLRTPALNKEISVDRNPNAGLAEAVIYAVTAFAFTTLV